MLPALTVGVYQPGLSVCLSVCLSVTVSLLHQCLPYFTGLGFGLPPALTVGVYQPGVEGLEYFGLCETNSLILHEEILQTYWLVLIT